MSSSYEYLDDMLVYSDNTFRLLQNRTGTLYYQAKCNECDTWFDVDFDNIVYSIDGLEVGNPDEPIKIDFKHKVNAVIETCSGCQYKHVYDSRTYKEITVFTSSEILETCFYHTDQSVYGRLPYKLSEAYIIARYILSLVSISIFMVGFDDDYFRIVKSLIISNKIMEPCLVSVIMCDIIDKCEYDDDVFDEWDIDGLNKLTVEQLEHCDNIARLLL